MRLVRYRISVVVTCALTLGALAPLGASADHDIPLLPDVFPKIRTLVNPLSSQPAIVKDGSTLLVELDADDVNASPLEDVGAMLEPSFGSARDKIELKQIDVEKGTASQLWPRRNVHALRYSIPKLRASFVEDLYDLTVTLGDQSDTQHRAVQVVDSFPKDPTFAIIADPSVGDPRPVQEGAEDLVATGSPDPLIEKTTKTIGNPMYEDRWAALGKAIEEINLLDPDFVLVTGDLTFLLYPRPANVEYEDAYRILSRLRVPAYMTPGNHDLYDLDYDDLDRPHTTDGKELWPLYFGPLHYSVDVGPDLHLVSVNTFDWADDQREALDEGNEFETRSGGQIDKEQLRWLERDLVEYRRRNPGGDIVTFAHHDPSWIKARHPWPGKNRLETRDLLAELKVGVHFAGHTHEDRVARYHQGNVVETNGRSGPKRQLHYVLRNDSLVESRSQDALGGILRDRTAGPLFVTTTTVSSVLKGSDWGLGSYWGYRYGVLRNRDAEVSHRGGRVRSDSPYGFDPIHFGYPATRAFLDARAERPQNWNPDHAVFGLFSYPSYYLNASTEGANDGSEVHSAVRISNDLLVDAEIEVTLSVAGDGASVDGGAIVWERTTGDTTDVRVRTTVRRGDAVAVTAIGE